MHTKNFTLEIKSVEDTGVFTGYASVFGNLDSDGEVIDKGAFKRTLDHSKGVVPVLWQHDRTQVCAWGIEASEDDRGLKVKAQLLMDTDMGKYAYSFLKTGLEVGGKPGLSIGFTVPKNGDYLRDGTRHFREVALKEYSVVTFPANDQATVLSAKGAVPYQDLPLASEDLAWDQSASDTRVRAWAGGPDKDKIDWSKYKKAFLWFDSENAEAFTSYKLQIGDVIDGKLMAVPRGVMAAAGGHGVNASSIPDADKVKVRNAITRYYKKMGRESPFKSNGGIMLRFKAEDFNSSLQQAVELNALCDLRWTMERALNDTICDICEDADLQMDDKKSAIADSLQQYATAMGAWWGKYLDITAEDEKSRKEGRAISADTQVRLSAIGNKAETHMRESMGYLELSKAAHTKAIQAIGDLSSAYTWNDVNKPNPAGGGKAEDLTDDIKKLRERMRA